MPRVIPSDVIETGKRRNAQNTKDAETERAIYSFLAVLDVLPEAIYSAGQPFGKALDCNIKSAYHMLETCAHGYNTTSIA